MKTDFFNTRYRYGLKAKIIESGFKNMKEFCEYSGLSNTTMSKICTGRIKPDVKTAALFLETLNLKPNVLEKLIKGGK